MADIMGKAPGDVSYPTNKPKKLKKQADGNPFPYEMGEMVEGGVFDEERVDGFSGEPKYSPKVQENIGDDGRG